MHTLIFHFNCLFEDSMTDPKVAFSNWGALWSLTSVQ